MQKCLLAVAAVCTLGAGTGSIRADDFKVDPAHSGITFKIKHMGLSYVHGRFDTFSGSFSLDADDPSKSSFEMEIKTDSIDTNQKGRDGHLKSPDFFNAKQFPTITFKSTSVKMAKDGYEVTGDLTMHGVTKSITLTLEGGKKTQLQGKMHTGFSTDGVVKLTDFGIGEKFVKNNALGDDVSISIGLEGAQK